MWEETNLIYVVFRDFVLLILIVKLRSMASNVKSPAWIALWDWGTCCVVLIITKQNIVGRRTLTCLTCVRANQFWVCFIIFWKYIKVDRLPKWTISYFQEEMRFLMTSRRSVRSVAWCSTIHWLTNITCSYISYLLRQMLRCLEHSLHQTQVCSCV